MDIDYFVSHIKEELDGAKDYIKRAIEIKPMQAEWAKHLVEMSSQELQHATHLYNMFNEYYKILGQTYKEMPKYIDDARDEIIDTYAECAAVIKAMHGMFK